AKRGVRLIFASRVSGGKSKSSSLRSPPSSGASRHLLPQAGEGLMWRPSSCASRHLLPRAEKDWCGGASSGASRHLLPRAGEGLMGWGVIRCLAPPSPAGGRRVEVVGRHPVLGATFSRGREKGWIA